jgi:hypothetical protein
LFRTWFLTYCRNWWLMGAVFEVQGHYFDFCSLVNRFMMPLF